MSKIIRAADFADDTADIVGGCDRFYGGVSVRIASEKRIDDRVRNTVADLYQDDLEE